MSSTKEHVIVALRPATITTAMLGTLLLPVALVLGGSAQAAPAPTPAQIEQQIAELNRQAEQITEQYNQATDVLAQEQAKLDAARVRESEQQQVVAASRAQLGKFASAAYRAGGLDPTLQLVLASDPAAVLSDAATMRVLGNGKADALIGMQEAQARLTADRLVIAQQLAQLSATQQQMGQQRSAIEAKIAQSQAILNQLQASQRAQVLSAGAKRSSGSAPVGMTCEQANIQAPDARTATVIKFACDQLGKPYVYGASGPNSYDCSGLTMAAWAKVGVSLPHSAAGQYNSGTKISRDQLRPGDLVFFYSPISHNGLYIGNGLMIHAPHSGDVVKISSIDGMSFTGATRL